MWLKFWGSLTECCNSIGTSCILGHFRVNEGCHLSVLCLQRNHFFQGAVKLRSLLPVIYCSCLNTVQEVRFDFNIPSLWFEHLFSAYPYFLFEKILLSFSSIYCTEGLLYVVSIMLISTCNKSIMPFNLHFIAIKALLRIEVNLSPSYSQ